MDNASTSINGTCHYCNMRKKISKCTFIFYIKNSVLLSINCQGYFPKNFLFIFLKTQFFDAENPKNALPMSENFTDLCFKSDLLKSAILLNPKLRNEKYRRPWKL